MVFVVNYTKRPVCEFVVAKIDLILKYIIPFFFFVFFYFYCIKIKKKQKHKHPILGSKHLNYLDFKSASYIIKNKLGDPPPPYIHIYMYVRGGGT